jgi:hypothetical protein
VRVEGCEKKSSRYRYRYRLHEIGVVVWMVDRPEPELFLSILRLWKGAGYGD